jgi:hypothetical protein
MAYPKAGLINLTYGAGTFGRILSECGQHDIQSTKLRMDKHAYDWLYNYTSVFVCAS